ncbi:MAG TPA: non-lysosomal glucosylceramidase [Candidatus Sulfotelmatobacter sp.]|nr:non-lysosomal glucosylceramidase [Candidatus Sulfotelmatobacter sp.]
MKHTLARITFFFLAVTLLPSLIYAGDSIPKAAWKRGIGEPLASAGTKKPTIDGMIDDGYWQGAPVGGFGAGTFSRTYAGNFSRWHLKAGIHKYETLYANQFAMFQQAEGSPAVAQVLSSDHPKAGSLTSWKWDYPVGAGDYYSLYPKSWYDYRWDRFPAHVVLEQFSPILPDNYRESSYPVAVYRWHAENPTNQTVTVSVLLSWTNMVGWTRGSGRDFSGHLSEGDRNRFMSDAKSGAAMKGIVFDRNRAGSRVTDEWDGQMAIATVDSPGVEITYQTTYRPDEDGAEVWAPFAKDGRLANSDQQWISSDETLAGAIAVRFTLKPGEKRVIPMVIAWDLPIVEFGSGRKWYRHYTDFYGTTGTNAWKIAADGLSNAAKWSDAIDAWQSPIASDESKPLWYRGELFNELYIVADGGSLWGRPVGSEPKSPHTFGFLECFDYSFYDTLDVLFYGSMPMLKFWPDLDKQVLRQFADTVPQEMADKYIWQWKSVQTGQPQFRTRKAKGAVPHDLGVPNEDPFLQVNQFSWQNTNGWKDLNSKLVLMIYRDYIFTGRSDVQFLRYTWPAVKEAMEYLGKFDSNGDGMPDSDGFPDQTYDEWVVRGQSAYAGSLWLAALRAAEEIGKTLGDEKSAEKYQALFAKGQASYIKNLWNGDYFLYDTQSEYKDNIQAEQLAGQWYANMTGLGDLVPQEMQHKALKKVFDYNVMKFGNGDMGAVSGMAADGSVIHSNQQVGEVWTGATFSVAALMLSDGMKTEAYRTAWGVYHVVYETKGYWFRTPEAYDLTGNFRASMYMRPAGIWAMEMTGPPVNAADANKAKVLKAARTGP